MKILKRLTKMVMTSTQIYLYLIINNAVNVNVKRYHNEHKYVYGQFICRDHKSYSILVYVFNINGMDNNNKNC